MIYDFDYGHMLAGPPSMVSPVLHHRYYGSQEQKKVEHHQQRRPQ